jgi:hypothetical protein
MRSEELDKNQFDARLQQVLDQRNCPESDSRLCEFAVGDGDAAAMLRAAEIIASPPAVVVYPAADFAERILAKILAEDAAEMRRRTAPIWRRKAGLYWGMGIAAAASFAIMLGVWNSPSQSNFVTAKPAEKVNREELPSTENSLANLPSDEAQKVLMRQFVVQQDKVAELRSGLNPFRSTLNVTLHVLRSTVPTRTPQPPHRPVEGKPSTAVLSPKWIV